MEYVHIVSKLGKDDAQVWSIDLPYEIFEQYAHCGSSVRGSVADILDELKEILEEE